MRCAAHGVQPLEEVSAPATCDRGHSWGATRSRCGLALLRSRRTRRRRHGARSSARALHGDVDTARRTCRSESRPTIRRARRSRALATVRVGGDENARVGHLPRGFGAAGGSSGPGGSSIRVAVEASCDGSPRRPAAGPDEDAFPSRTRAEDADERAGTCRPCAGRHASRTNAGPTHRFRGDEDKTPRGPAGPSRARDRSTISACCTGSACGRRGDRTSCARPCGRRG
jgi:hypothetical protein